MARIARVVRAALMLMLLGSECHVRVPTAAPRRRRAPRTE
ncbi:hypothetical protein YT1_1440 [Rhodococcus ruber]|nr:hypothetical protein YT1_1440 [Rhodococcus ruber]